MGYFASYDLVARSPLFDPDYYLRQIPEAEGQDPVAHFIEVGAGLGLDPGPGFDTAFYLKQCAPLGEAPANPLIHFHQTGERLGLIPRPGAVAGGVGAIHDVIRLDTVTVSPTPDGDLAVKGAGWLAPSRPVARFQVDIGGERLGFATHGVDRPDVTAAFPGAPGVEACGFTFHIEPLPEHLVGETELVLTARLEPGGEAGPEFVRGRFTLRLPDRRAPANGAAPNGASGPPPLNGKPQGIESLGAPPCRIQIDEALVDARGVVKIEGWAIGLAPVASVDVWLDDRRLGAAEYGSRRDDVAKAFPDYVNPADSGFKFLIDSRGLGEGPRDFIVRCQMSGGLARDIRVPLILRPAPKAAQGDEAGRGRVHCDDIRLATDGSLKVEGWAICGLGVEAVLVILDGVEVGRARHGLERPDVGNSFPDVPGSRNAGFSFVGNVAPGGIEGEHVLAVRILTPQGRGGGVRVPIAAVAAAPATAAPAAAAGNLEVLTLFIDAPAVLNGAATSPVRNSLSIAGWAVGLAGVQGVDIAIDGKRVASAFYGLKREDVAAIMPDYPGALLCGFAAMLPNRALPKGERLVGVTARDKEGREVKSEFTIQVEELDEEEPGPWSLRRRMPRSEIDLAERLLTAQAWRPAFGLLLATGTTEEAIAGARLTLTSLRDQAYGDWRLIIAPTGADGAARRLKRLLRDGFEDLAGRIFWAGPGRRAQGLDRLMDRVMAGAPPGPRLYGVLTGGDELGVDALLAIATWTALKRDVDFVYGDERRINLGTGKLDTFFKPDWSPDLALSTNYIGRPWFAKPQVFAAARATLGELESLGHYDLVLRCLEAARSIGHAPSVLCERLAVEGEAPDLERGALERAIERRGLAATVAAGPAPGLYSVERTHAVTGLVSIIIPTCAAKGYIKTCLDTLRGNTLYRNFEIVCIENIPPALSEWRDWLRANADVVVSTEEPFNWSRFNNLAAAKAHGDYLVFLNDDIEIISPNWLDVLLSHAARPDVGIVGPLLLYPDRTIQHAGMFLSHMGVARHAFRFGPQDDPGYFGLALSERNVISVTGACLMVRREVYDAVGGFDETHTVINNDLDFCLRVGDRGLLTVFTPRTRLIHHELASRSEIPDEYDAAAFDDRWGELFLRGDPYFHRHLSKDEDHFQPDREPLRIVYPSHPLMSRDQVRRILVVKVDHIGDCVTALPAIRRLRELFPRASLSILAAPFTLPIWSLASGVDEVIPFQFFHARSGDGEVAMTKEALAELRARLAPRRFDIAIDLRKTTDTRLLLQCSGARYLAGFAHQRLFPWLDIAVEWEGDPRHESKRAHITDDFIRLVQAVALACDDDRTVLTPKVGPSPLPADMALGLHARRVVVIHPAAGTPTREWPPIAFARLIDLLVADFDVNIAIIGGGGDQPTVDAILSAVRHKDRAVSLLGTLSLAQLAQFLPACALFVGNNSGPSHLASALGVPTVAVHSGVIASEEWAPFGPMGVAIRKDMYCAPCYISKAEECTRGLACVTRLTPGEVLEVCRRFLVLGNGAADRARPEPAEADAVI